MRRNSSLEEVCSQTLLIRSFVPQFVVVVVVPPQLCSERAGFHLAEPTAETTCCPSNGPYRTRSEHDVKTRIVRNQRKVKKERKKTRANKRERTGCLGV